MNTRRPPVEPGPSHQAPAPKSVVRSRRSRRWSVVLYAVFVLVAVRILLPYVLLHVANKRLADTKGYYGHIADLNLAIIRGAYQLEGFYLDKQDSLTHERTKFLRAGLIDLSVQWGALFHGSIVGELVIDSAEVRFTKEAAEPAELQKDTSSFRDLLHDFMPLKINRLEVHHSAIRYSDPTSTPKVDVQLDRLEALALNLTNAIDSNVVLPSRITAMAGLYDGDLDFNMGIDLLNETPTFDMNAKLTRTQLTNPNAMLQAYANVDVNKGTMSLYAEVATRDGAFTGYVKPVIKDLDVLGREDKDEPFFHKVREGLVGTVGDLLENPTKDQVATKIKLNGKLDNVKVSAIYAVIELLRNAFIQALKPAIDQEINIANVGEQAAADDRGFLQKLFNPDNRKGNNKEAQPDRHRKNGTP